MNACNWQVLNFMRIIKSALRVHAKVYITVYSILTSPYQVEILDTMASIGLELFVLILMLVLLPLLQQLIE